MIFTDIPKGARLFVDANCLVYHFGPDPVVGPPCRELMERIDRKEIHAYTSTHILSDVAHRLMTMEAMTRLGWPATGIAPRLRRHPTELKQLTDFRAAIETIHNSKLQIFSVPADQVVVATSISQQFGLLSDDALIVALMQANGLVDLASNDADFDRVPMLTRYAPM